MARVVQLHPIEPASAEAGQQRRSSSIRGRAARRSPARTRCCSTRASRSSGHSADDRHPVTSRTAGGPVYRIPPTTSLNANITSTSPPSGRRSGQTTYDFERHEFASQIVSLQRDMHDWRAMFGFTQSPNGNFAFNFTIALKAEPDSSSTTIGRRCDRGRSKAHAPGNHVLARSTIWGQTPSRISTWGLTPIRQIRVAAFCALFISIACPSPEDSPRRAAVNKLGCGNHLALRASGAPSAVLATCIPPGARMRLSRWLLAALIPLAACEDITGLITDPDAPANLTYQLTPSGDPECAARACCSAGTSRAATRERLQRLRPPRRRRLAAARHHDVPHVPRRRRARRPVLRGVPRSRRQRARRDRTPSRST